MKMKAFISIAFLIITGFSFGQLKLNWSKIELKGKVKKLEKIYYYMEGASKTESINSIYHFNKKGRVDSLELFHEISPNTYTITRFIYNSQSVLINSVKTIYEDGVWDNYTVSDWRRRKYFYNSKGVLVKIKEVNADTLLTREIELKYDDSGRIKKVIDNDIDFSNLMVTSWTYTANGSISNQTSSRRKYRVVRYFDKQGLETKSQWTQPIKSKKYTEDKFSYEFDSKGNWIHIKTSSRDVAPTLDEVVWKSDTGVERKITYYE